MIKLPPLKSIVQKAGASFTRFPLTIISSMLSAATAMFLVNAKYAVGDFTLINAMLTFALGIPLFFSVSILIERSKFSSFGKVVSYFLAIAILLFIYFSFPKDESLGSVAIPYIRYVLYNVSIHLFVSFVPFLRSGNYNGFWQYNKTLFLRILEAILYSGFLYGGLALALASLELLFSLEVDVKLYAHLFIFIVGVFNTWFFVSEIPKDFEKLRKDENYPNGLKIFTQYILLPLLSVYLIILYSYGIKIISLWDWPQGIVSYLIICVAVVGIFLVLLLYPYQKSASNSWVKKFSTIYYYALIPLIVMLFIAIGIRVGDYGLTINRYIIILLGIWLSMVCAYYLVKRESIKFIPMSLAAVIILSSFGPWGMFSVSERSQLSRLHRILEKKDFLKEGKIKNEVKLILDEKYQLVNESWQQRKKIELGDSLHYEVKSILDYLEDYHGLNSVDEYFNQNVDSLISLAKDSIIYINRSRIYMQTMGLDYFKQTTTGQKYFTYSTNVSSVEQVSGFDYLAKIYANTNSNRIKQSYKIDEKTYQSHLDGNEFELFSISDTLTFDLTEKIKVITKKYGYSSSSDISPVQMVVKSENTLYDAELRIETMSLIKEEDIQLSSVNVNLLLKKKLAD